LFAAIIVIFLSVSVASAASMADVVKAQAVINKINEIAEKYRELTMELEAPASLDGAKGKYFVPFSDDRELTEWAEKALSAQAGAAAGEKAGSAVGKALGSKIPFGGFGAGAAKRKGKQMGAATAIGGMAFIKKTTDRSLSNVDDYIVYLQVKHSGSLEYQKAMASAMALYPEMEGRTDIAMKNAYKKAAKAAKKKK
jgi:hypothetical protein